MSIQYKFDIMDRLKNSGYSSYKLRQDKTLSEATMTKFRNGSTNITIENISTLCRLLNCQPGDILEYVPDAPEINHFSAAEPISAQLAADTGDEHDRVPQTSLKKQKEAFEHYKD